MTMSIPNPNPQVAFHRLVRSLRQAYQYFSVEEVLAVAFGESVSVASQLRLYLDHGQSINKSIHSPINANDNEALPVERAIERTSSSGSDSDDGIEVVFAKIKKPPTHRIVRQSEPNLQAFPTHKYSLRAQSVLFDALHEYGPYQSHRYAHLSKLTKLSRGEISAWFNCKRRLFKMKLTVEANSTNNYARAANEIFLDSYYKGDCNCLGKDKDCFMNLHIKH